MPTSRRYLLPATLLFVLSLSMIACVGGPRPHPKTVELRTGAATAEQASRAAQAEDLKVVRYASSSSDAPEAPTPSPSAEPKTSDE